MFKTKNDNGWQIWFVYLLNFILTVVLLVLKYFNVIAIPFIICILPVTLFTIFLGIILIIITMALIEERQNGNRHEG